jgi:transcriptional regulator with XRE-family HTH domain
MIMSTFGERLKNLRKSKKMKQEDLAEVLNISKSAVGMYERNEREPSYEMLESISNYFNESIDFLLTGKEKKKENSNLFFFDTEGLTDEEIEDIQRHINYVRWKAEQERKK